MHVKSLDRSATTVEYGVPTLRTLPWDGVVTPPFGSMWAVLQPGMQTDLDVHDEHETLVVTAGRGAMTIGDETRDVAAGDLVVVPPTITHTLRNTGDGELVALFIWWDAP
jgi:mannose-6-phosphate isomerase-like protein (cupin superfamily)